LWFFHSGLHGHDAVAARTGPCVPISPTGPVSVQRLSVAALAVQIVGRRVVSGTLGRFNTKLTRCYEAAGLANKSATPISPSEIRKFAMKAGAAKIFSLTLTLTVLSRGDPPS
jgi:hypothetical protein